MDVSWKRVAPDFSPDGALRDIYVQNATLADWELALELVRRNYVPATFSRDGAAAALPALASDAFAQRLNAAVALDFEVGGIEVACHFFTPDEIEFDLPPEQVNSQERFVALLEFLRALATTLGKNVILSPESAPHLPILSVDSAGLVLYHPASDAPAT